MPEKSIPQGEVRPPEQPIPPEDMTETERDAMGFEVADDSKIAHADFLTAIILIGVSLYVIITSIGYWQRQGRVFYESTGFMPVLIGVGLLLMSLRLLRETMRHGNAREFLGRLRNAASAMVRSNTVHRSLLGLAVFGAYVFFLLGKMEFWLASFIALGVVLVFVRFDGKWQTALKMVLIAALCVAGIVGLFQYAFEVPMP